MNNQVFLNLQKLRKERRNKMYKMVIIDLDGTLLNDEKQVSKKNAETIHKIWQEKQVYFVIATRKKRK